jgi:hypothetical protein
MAVSSFDRIDSRCVTVSGVSRLVAIAAAAVVLALGGRANAEPPATATTARLVYLRGAGTDTCPDEGALRDAVAARLGYDPFTPFSLDTLFAEVDRDGPAFVARVKLVAHDNTVRGARTLKTTGACDDLMATLALTISLAIDPMASIRGGPPEGLPPKERPVEIHEDANVEPPPPAAPPPNDEAPAPPPPSRPVRIAVGAGVLGAIGTAPGPGVGFLLFARARLGDVSGTLEGRADLASGGDADEGPGRVSSSLLAATLMPCGHTGDFFACARGTLGRISAEGLDVTHPGSSTALWASAGGRIGWELGLGRLFAVRIHGDADLVLTRYALSIGGRTAFRYSPVAGSLGAAFVAVLR